MDRLSHHLHHPLLLPVCHAGDKEPSGGGGCPSCHRDGPSCLLFPRAQ
ncbi:hypothetical protein E2C01_090935 [Portunus trituberculatus]|uniref:Uncharacterized protein n=1 Tax=Portunus trituberculatus TaxID=210409 RepID=A0A5B7JCN9_PORTR|nr:hypothetical protein [Portunus trituberculatus]